MEHFQTDLKLYIAFAHANYPGLWQSWVLTSCSSTRIGTESGNCGDYVRILYSCNKSVKHSRHLFDFTLISTLSRDASPTADWRAKFSNDF